ncbi:MAG: hypothetical protein JWO44_2038 [Bacteroidetes bacterium]|nr:hypothetical protein [Bacteroidota bacterium]
MRKLPVHNTPAYFSNSNARFLILGREEAQTSVFQPIIDAKVNKKVKEQVPGIWGTLGMENGDNILWQGNLAFSKSGNDQSTGRTLEQVKELYHINSELNGADSKVIERFINFDDIEFPSFPKTFTEEEIPNLRLTLFLRPDEGALVFFQHFKESYTSEDGSDIEFILPQKTENFTTDRDRLTYIFPVLPKQKIIETSTPGLFTLSDTELNKSFVLKVLTFKRNNIDHHPDQVMKSISFKVRNGADGHRLLRFVHKQNKFYEVNNNDVLVDPNAKTLFLIHGTFSSTDNSYNGLLKQEYDNNTKSWIQKTMETRGYLQVLALDHPTISYDAKGNVQELIRILNGVTFSKNASVDIITTSRGGLVGKYITCCMDNDQLPVRKMVNIACANGVGYFDTGRHIARFLSIWKSLAALTGNPMGSVILGFAQFSADYFLAQPGCRQMTINDERLTSIISKEPSEFNKKLRIQPITGDWDASLVQDDGLFKRLAERGLDAVIKTSLGKENDWVVGTEKQRITPANYSNPPILVRSMHVKYLNSDYCPDKVHEKIWNFLDA